MTRLRETTHPTPSTSVLVVVEFDNDDCCIGMAGFDWWALLTSNSSDLHIERHGWERKPEKAERKARRAAKKLAKHARKMVIT